ncbi:MAG: RodZ domain-containing protein [Candidatus Acidiferrales bacterium]
MSTTTLFGEHLKREREMRGVSLEEISAATRISVKFLEALENERWEQLPGGIFNRGFIRSVARFLGMDEDNLVAEYALETRERPEIAVWTKEPVRKRPNWFAICGTIVALALIVAGGWYVHRAYGPSISAWHQSHPIFRTVMARLHRKKATADSPASAAPAIPLNAQQQKAATGQTTTGGNSQNQWNSPAANSTATNGQAADAGASSVGAAGASGQTGATAGKMGTQNDAAATLNSSGAMELKVEAGETSMVTVAADGKVVFSGKLEALKTLTLHAENSFTVSASKSNAVLLELNGRTVPPLGPPNEPGKITLTRENLKSSPGDEY